MMLGVVGLESEVAEDGGVVLFVPFGLKFIADDE